ncbi:uncharacterized protein V1516DRAFT_676578 [Lipomyces oligophaga]|uniref:uncharacterized protein n=1 Tax=Lipomyces oligophaga TaxID=45792 RepID=UPI0034CF8352
MANRAVRDYSTPIFVAGMLITGCSNSLLTKFQDNQCVEFCDGPLEERRYFEQPVVQTFQMFIAEAACWGLVFFDSMMSTYHSGPSPSQTDVEEVGGAIDDLQITSDANMTLLSTTTSGIKPDSPALDGRRVFNLSLPAFCDICGTTLMNVGLFFTPVSIYQMTRGSLVLFVGLFSVVFLNRRLEARQWGALFMVVLGVFVVGLSGVLYADESSNSAVERSLSQVAFGIILIALAQLFTATQFVYEEHILTAYHLDSMRVVGYEGVFGLALTGLIMITAYITVGHSASSHGGYFDTPTAVKEIFTHTGVLVTSVFIMLSIGAFNFFGISVTRKISATSRSTIDTCRTLCIWLLSITFGWEEFNFLQLLGFSLLVYGTLVFNHIISPYILDRFDPEREGQVRLEDED